MSEKIKKLVQEISLIQNSHIDVGFAQGRNAIISQIELWDNLRDAEKATELYIKRYLQELQSIILWIKPYILPDDYLFFLNYYGGLNVEDLYYNFGIYGTGPMSEEWYPFLKGDEVYSEPQKDGVLTIGFLVSKNSIKSFNILFFLDLAGIIKQYSVIALSFESETDAGVSEVIKNLEFYSSRWKLVSSSFTDWLTVVAQTKGGFGYDLMNKNELNFIKEEIPGDKDEIF